jgi:oligopeptide/dipeptide ABC transporter ATP-binding protein
MDSQPIFEVSHLRVAAFDSALAVGGAFDAGVARTDMAVAVTDAGEVLSPGWVEVLPDMSFSVNSGEVLALVGESGSGKSLALMGGFSLLSQGTRVLGGETRFEDATFLPGGETTVSDSKLSRKQRKESRLAGTVVADYSDDRWTRIVGTRIGFMFQNPVGSWTPDLVIGEQTGESLAAHSDLTTDEIEARVFDALGEVELPQSRRLFGAFRHELSRGMAQRAMLAAAITKAPSLLVADEPLNGLDPPVAAAIMNLIKDMQVRRGMAMIIVTHDLAAVAKVADRVAIVYGGVIVEEAPVAEIYHHPKHPYTAGLIGSIPGIRQGRLRTIKGEAPRLVDVDRARCVFAGRCDLATEICQSSQPEMRIVGESSVACHHATPEGLPGISG